MKEVIHLNRAIFGGYKRQDVQEYIDDFYAEMESRYKDVSDTVNSLERENDILRQYINESQDQENSLVELIETGEEVDLLQLPEGIYQFDHKQAIRPLMTTKSLAAAGKQDAQSTMPADFEQELENIAINASPQSLEIEEPLPTKTNAYSSNDATTSHEKEMAKPLYENNGHYYTPNSTETAPARDQTVVTELEVEFEDKTKDAQFEQTQSNQSIVSRSQFLISYIQQELDDFTGQIEQLQQDNRQLTQENLQLNAKLEFANGLLKELYREGL